MYSHYGEFRLCNISFGFYNGPTFSEWLIGMEINGQPWK